MRAMLKGRFLAAIARKRASYGIIGDLSILKHGFQADFKRIQVLNAFAGQAYALLEAVATGGFGSQYEKLPGIAEDHFLAGDVAGQANGMDGNIGDTRSESSGDGFFSSLPLGDVGLGEKLCGSRSSSGRSLFLSIVMILDDFHVFEVFSSVLSVAHHQGCRDAEVWND